MNCSIKIERAFGIIKENHKFGQFLLRGKKKVKIEFLLIFNIRKLHAKIENELLGAAFHQKKLCQK